MANLRSRLRAVVVIMGFTAMSCIGFAACGGDDTIGGTGDGGNDSTTDATNDVRNDVGRDVSSDAVVDTSVPDVNVPDVDASSPDAADAHDASDSSDADAHDASDAADGADALDASDAADAPDTSDATPPILGYPFNITAALCQRFENCCAPFDAGTFDQGKCQQVILNRGGLDETYTAATSGAVSTGNLTFDPVNSAKCFSAIAAIQCQNDPAAHWQQVRALCWAGMNGSLATGKTCSNSLECAPGLYCQASAGNTCQAIQPLGGSCATESNYACTYQENGITPPAFCGSGATCIAQLPLTSACTFDRECSSGHCVNSVCSSTDPGVTAGLCTFFAKAPTDAGAD